MNRIYWRSRPGHAPGPERPPRAGGRRAATLAVALPALLASACATTEPAALRTPGAPSAPVEGVWVGWYSYQDQDRAGSLRLELGPGEGQVEGWVLAAEAAPTAPTPLPTREETSPADPNAVSLFAWIQVENGYLSGVMEPFEDPLCGCVLRTRFMGRVYANLIRGTFVALTEGGESIPGTWRVERP